ncbi:winged helix-turn-helix transcriptional regulator [Streptomyces puniciscabiei]
MKPLKQRSTCPISSALDIFGDKWSLLVMRDLLLRDKHHYRDFLASEEGIATNILADRLARLKWAGLIEKTDDEPRSGRQAYSATAKGADLIPTLLQMLLWSADHNPLQIATPPVLVAEVKADFDRTARGVREHGSVEAFLHSL